MAAISGVDGGGGEGPTSELAPVTGTDAGTVDSLGRWIIAWSVGILIIWLLNKTRWGHTIIYYTLVLMLVFLFLTQYQFIAWALQPFSHIGNSAGGEPPPAGAPAGAPPPPGHGVSDRMTGGARDLTAPAGAAYLTAIPRRRATPVTL